MKASAYVYSPTDVEGDDAPTKKRIGRTGFRCMRIWPAP